jgi:HEAT repeat protein
MRLAADGRTDLVDTAIAWLSHPESMLRSEAITMLLVFWRRESAFPKVLELLHHDPDPDIRGAAAGALSRFVEHAPSYRARVLDALFYQLTHDDDPITQRTCYKKLLQHILPKEAVPDIPHRFNRETDVDWELLRPWRSKVN